MEEEVREQFKRVELEDNDGMISVGMDTYGVTSASHNYPILKTIGTTFCVSTALYSPDRKIAGLMHMTPPSITLDLEGTQQSLLNILGAMERNGVDSSIRQEIEAHIIGGVGEIGLVKRKIVMQVLNRLGIKRVLTNEEAGGNLVNFAIDARSGEVFNLINIRSLDNHTRTGTVKPKGGVQLTGDPKSLK